MLPSAMWRRTRSAAMSFGLMPLLLVCMFLAFGIYEPRFWRLDNLVNILRNASYLMIIACGQMLVLITRGLDLSVGAVAALASVGTAITMSGIYSAVPESPALAIAGGSIAGLFIGATAGLFNGLSVALLKVHPIMVTLGTFAIGYGIAYYYTSGIPVYGMPESFTPGFGSLLLLGIPASVLVTGVILGVLWWVMDWTKLGRYIYAIGGNVQAARVSGVPIDLYLVAAYTICGLLAATTGILLTARVGSGEANLGQSLMLESIAAAVISGVALRGGVGRVEWVAVGALFLTLLTNGMNLIRVESKLQPIVVGIILILSVAMAELNGARRR